MQQWLWLLLPKPASASNNNKIIDVLFAKFMFVAWAITAIKIANRM